MMLRRKREEEGFATVTAVMLCAGLAVVSVALIDLGLASARRVAGDIEREAEQQLLRSAIAETAADLVDDPGRGLGSVIKRYGDLKIEVTVANEIARTNVYLASDTQLTDALARLANADGATLVARLAAERSDGLATGLSMDGLLAKIEARPREAACLRERLTVHASSLDPFAVGGETPPAKDAAIVNLRARIVEGRPLDITREAIIVLTGDSQAPLLVLEERSFRSSLTKGCFDEAT